MICVAIVPERRRLTPVSVRFLGIIRDLATVAQNPILRDRSGDSAALFPASTGELI